MNQMLVVDTWVGKDKVSLRSNGLSWHLEVMDEEGHRQGWGALSVTAPALYSNYVGHTLPLSVEVTAIRGMDRHKYNVAITRVVPMGEGRLPIRLFPSNNSGLFVKALDEWVEVHPELLPMQTMASSFLNVVANAPKSSIHPSEVDVPDNVGLLVCREGGDLSIVPMRAYLEALLRGDGCDGMSRRVLRSGLVQREALIDLFKEYV